MFSDRHKEIDYCYYYDKERFCHGNDYELLSDSILKINDEQWVYKKQDNKFYVSRYLDGAFEAGFVSSLVPFETLGPFVTTTDDKKDTLWITDYSFDTPANPYDRPKYTFHKTMIKGKIYNADKVDEIPTLLNGDSIPEIKLERKDVCYSEPFYWVRTMSFVITTTGRIVNIKQDMGNIDDSCPYYIMDLTRYIYRMSPLKPSKKKGENVNVKWIVKVDMGFDWAKGTWKQANK